jgi:hypothetical protein
MSTIKVTVLKCTASEKNPGVNIITVRNMSEGVEALGTKLTGSQSTYYMATVAPVAVGTTHELNMDMFQVQERPYPVTDKVTGEIKTLQLKWLRGK